MRPLTEALLRANTEGLVQKGWKPEEQRRCFKKADALLDYMDKVPSGDYQSALFHSRICSARVAGFVDCLKQGMPSQTMQARSLTVLNTLLFVGEKLLVRSAWLFKHYPALFKAKYASSPQAFAKDIHGYFVRGHSVPEDSFVSFKTGKNPAFSTDKDFIAKCIQMYNDPIFETSEFQQYRCQIKSDTDPYIRWTRDKKMGKKFTDERLAWKYEIDQLLLKTQVGLKLGKAELARQIQMKKQKHI